MASRPKSYVVGTTTTVGGNPWLDIIFSPPPTAFRAVRFQVVVLVPAGYIGYPRYKGKIQLDDGKGTEPSHGELGNFMLEAGLDAPSNTEATDLGMVAQFDIPIPEGISYLGVLLSGIQPSQASNPYACTYVEGSGILEVSME